MQALPVTPGSPSSTPGFSEKSLGGQNHVFPEELGEEEVTEDPCRSSQSEETERDAATFRYRSHANVLSRSFRGHNSAAARFVARNKSDQDMKSLGSGVTVSAGSDVGGVGSDEGVGEVVGERPGSGKIMEQATGTGSQESSTCTSTEGSRTELSVGEGEESVKTPTFKSHPYSRRIDITPLPRTRPRILEYGNSELDIKRKCKTGPAMLARRSTLASIPTTRRLLPAPPIRRGSRLPSHASVTSPSSDEKSESSSDVPTPGPGSSQSVSSFASKLANSLEDHVESSGVTGENRDLLAKPRPCAAARSESLSSLHSKEDPPPSPKVKHTVQYKNSVQFIRGEQDMFLWSCIFLGWLSK